MRKQLIGSTIAVATMAAFLLLAPSPTAGQAPAPGQLPPYKAPRRADGRPDLSGIWQALNTANWDIQDHAAQPGLFPQLLGAVGAVPGGQGVVEGNEIPYQPWALAKKKENFENRMTADPFDRTIGDPEAKCYMPGVPRATYQPFPFQIVQGTDKIIVAYEFANGSRIIHLDKVGPAPIDSWMGWSVGRWEGDTLVVDVTGFNGLTWFDRAGNFHSDALHVVERYTLVSPYHLMYEVTIEDPKVFTRPWKMSMPLYRRMDRSAQLLEFKCVEFSEEFIYGTLRKKPTQ